MHMPNLNRLQFLKQAWHIFLPLRRVRQAAYNRIFRFWKKKIILDNFRAYKRIRIG
jgi:hypothetical protein